MTESEEKAEEKGLEFVSGFKIVEECRFLLVLKVDYFRNGP